MNPRWRLELGVLLLFSVAGVGCAERKPAKLVIPRRCMTDIKLTEQTRCVQARDGSWHCWNFKLDYTCTEVQHGAMQAAPHHVPVAEGELPESGRGKECDTCKTRQ